MRLVFDESAKACTFESGEIKLHFHSSTNDDFVGWLLGPERFKIDSSKLKEQIVDGKKQLVIDYEKITSEEAKNLHLDDLRFACSRLYGSEGLEIVKNGVNASITDLSIDERLSLIRAIEDEKPELSEWVSTYIRGSKKKYAGLHVDHGEVGSE
jgi:hypothetical protein